MKEQTHPHPPHPPQAPEGHTAHASVLEMHTPHCVPQRPSRDRHAFFSFIAKCARTYLEGILHCPAHPTTSPQWGSTSGPRAQLEGTLQEDLQAGPAACRTMPPVATAQGNMGSFKFPRMVVRLAFHAADKTEDCLGLCCFVHEVFPASYEDGIIRRDLE